MWMRKDGENKPFTKIYTVKAKGRSVYHTILGFRKNGEVVLEVRGFFSEETEIDVYKPSSGRINSVGIVRKRLKRHRIEHGFKRAFMSLFGQDADTFTSTMLLNVDHLQKQLDKAEFQEDGSMTAFGRDTLLQHMGNVKKSVFERARHQRQFDRRVNKRLMQTQESKIDMGKAVNDDLVVTKSSGTESEVHDDNSRSGNDTDADDTIIRSIYDKEQMAKVQLTTECNIFAIGQQHTKQPEIINEGQQHTEQPEIINEGQHGQILNETSNKANIKKKIDVLETINIELEHSLAKLRKENETLKKHYKDLYDSIKITRSKTIKHTTSLLANNADLKAQIQEKVDSYKKLFDSCTSKVDSEPLHGSNVDISNIHECKQTLDVSAGTLINVQKEQRLDLSASTLCNVNKENLRVLLLKKQIS
nr:putative F-box domain-containing protein [Tanacetum cinerariifolium]